MTDPQARSNGRLVGNAPGHANAASGAWDGDARQARVGASRATVAMLILGNACRVAYPARRAGSHAIGARGAASSDGDHQRAPEYGTCLDRQQ